jgi:hypothetical protein
MTGEFNNIVTKRIDVLFTTVFKTVISLEFKMVSSKI